MIGCDCKTCQSEDNRDKRTRSSILVCWEENGTTRNVLVDASTDLRFQSLTYGLKRIDAVLFTHSHADHVHGIDELRSFNFIQREEIPCYGSPETLDIIKRRFEYIFSPGDNAKKGGGIPKLTLNPVEGDFRLFGRNISILPVRHGEANVLGYGFGPFIYITDCNSIPEATTKKIGAPKIIVIGAVQKQTHATHFGLYEAVEVIKNTGAGKGYITHMNHDIMHEEVSRELPPNIFLAYDGLVESV
jgi:phosphoribosyl 1,2-cyclic phosphate phosphodiesterase